MYTDRPDGLSGNEDVGQMSAWYILSALGFYQVNPSGGVFVFGSPAIDEATIDVGGGKQFHVLVKNNSPVNKYIQQISVNGKPSTKSFLRYEDIKKGGDMVIQMGAKPSQTWGVKEADRPHSSIE
jgi:putative alpha-1,2-mannosidase